MRILILLLLAGCGSMQHGDYECPFLSGTDRAKRACAELRQIHYNHCLENHHHKKTLEN